jgi:ZIP family zinc transporter
MEAQTGSNVGVAFALTFAAGFATVLGGMVVLSKRLVYLANPLSLAVALSISGGVMTFISLVEIFGESVHLFTAGVATEDMSEQTATGHGWLLATVCFVLGVALIYAIDALVHHISPHHAEEHEHVFQNLPEIHERLSSHLGAAHPDNHEASLEFNTSPAYVAAQEKLDMKSRADLNRMGILSALAIGMHNMPEGIATYVGASQNTSVGFSLAIGIALHNIPEGIAVAAPIYFATGSRWRGIMWCAISALAEPLGGFLAWLVIGDGMDPISEGILFGMVCGIMVCISIKELFPTAFKFAGPEKSHFVAFGAFTGMLIMATSLILFGYAGV